MINPIMKYLFSVFVILELVTLYDYNSVKSYVIPRNVNFMQTSWGDIFDDYLTYDSEEGQGIEVLGCEGKDCSNPADNDVNNLVDVDYSTGYDENEMPNELPLIGQPSKNEKGIRNISEIERTTTTANDLNMGSSEISDLLDSLSDILDLNKKLESAPPVNIFPEGVHNFGADLDVSEYYCTDPDGVGFESSEYSMNPMEDAVMGLADLPEEESFPGTGVEWLEDSDETFKVVENGYIYYDMESRE